MNKTHSFKECSICAVKPGSPELCESCIHNRSVISDLSVEVIICSAVRAKDGKIVRGHRHNDAMRTLHYTPGYETEQPFGDDQGFMTSQNRYVNRSEACRIQIAAGIDSKAGRYDYSGELYSEDLY